MAAESKPSLPETILQFGGGNFVRAFVDAFVDDANRGGQAVGRVVIVQSTRSGVADKINQQQGKYHLVTRGISDGNTVDQVTLIESVSRALDSQTSWNQLLAIGASQELRYIVSNTTEAGLALDPHDSVRPTNSIAPRSFPAKLLQVLWHRFESGVTGTVAILPCELLPKNGDYLRSLVLKQAGIWHASAKLMDWLNHECAWINSLVDRIVTGRPATHPLLESDALLTVAEPFALWAIEVPRHIQFFEHQAIEKVADTAPYELRKVRILNGAHTALVMKAMPLGITTVREAIEHPDVGPWLDELLNNEIVPAIDDRVPGAAAFVASTLERFANPYVEHRLESIALNHAAKIKTRLLPTRQDFIDRFGRAPKLLDELLEQNLQVVQK